MSLAMMILSLALPRTADVEWRTWQQLFLSGEPPLMRGLANVQLMKIDLKPYLQYQKPQVDMLAALSLPLIAGVFQFGWRVLLSSLFAMLVSWITEYLFTRKEGKPATSAGLVTGLILALIVPPNVPFWQIGVGCVFAIVFGKMVFGGFGRNVFNPAMVGRCFLYICFPATLAASWYVPHTGGAAGFLQYTTTKKVLEADASMYHLDGVTSATTLTGVKRLNIDARRLKEKGDLSGFQKATEACDAISLRPLFLGTCNGSVGETSALLILVSLVFLLIRKVVSISLVLSPLLGITLAKVFTTTIGADVLPFQQSLLISILGGGTLFAVVFMTTEPISAPINEKARWAYGLLIGFFGGIIRSMSAFNAGLMFAILLGNMFGPLIEIGIETLEKRGKEKTS